MNLWLAVPQTPPDGQPRFSFRRISSAQYSVGLVEGVNLNEFAAAAPQRPAAF